MPKSRKSKRAKSPHPLKGPSPIGSGGPSFIGAKGSGKTTQAGSKRGGRKIT